MDLFNALSTGRKIVLVGAVLLLIDTFLSWQSVTIGPYTASRSGWHGFWGVLLGLLTIAIIAWTILRMFNVALPATVPDGFTTLVLAGLIFIFALLKNLIDDYSAWPAYVGVVIAAVVAYGAWMNFQASGESLPSMPSTSGGGSPASSPPAPPEAPADESPGADNPT